MQPVNTDENMVSVPTQGVTQKPPVGAPVTDIPKAPGQQPINDIPLELYRCDSFMCRKYAFIYRKGVNY